MTATRVMRGGTSCVSSCARCADTCRFDGAKTNPIASAPASTAALTASLVVRPQILIQTVMLEPRASMRARFVRRLASGVASVSLS